MAIVCLSAGLGEAQQRNMMLASTPVCEKAAPPALTLEPDNSVTPCMFLVPFQLLPQHWSSEQVSPYGGGVGVVAALRGMLGTAAALLLTQSQSLLVFTARSYGDLSSWYWNPGFGSLVFVSCFCQVKVMLHEKSF